MGIYLVVYRERSQDFYVKQFVHPLRALQLPFKRLCTLCCKMPGLGECETYPDSLIEITIEHEGKAPVAKANKQQKSLLDFSNKVEKIKRTLFI